MAGKDIYVAFGADTGGLEAALALTKQNVTAMTRELNKLAKEMKTTGAAADSDLGQRMKTAGAALAETKSQARDISGQLGVLSGALHENAAAGHHGGTGIGFYLREVHALSDEFGSGRTRQGIGTLSNLIFTFLQSNTQWLPYAVAVGALGAAFGYVAYQAYATSKAVKGIEFDAALNQFTLTRDASAQLLASVEKLGAVSASDAREFIEPFLKLGPVGEAISAVASRYLPAFTANGKTAKEAGDELARSFADIAKGGGEVIASSRVLTDEEKRKAQAFIASGDTVGAYRYALDIMARSLGSVSEQQRKAKADIEDAQTKMAVGILTADNFAGAEDLLAAATANATQKTRDQEEEFSRWLLKAAMATDQAGRLAAAMKDALKVDKTSADIKELEGKVKEFQDALGTTKDPESIAQLNRSIDIASDKLKKARDELSGGLIGGSGLERINRENQALADAYKGPPAGLLRQQLANVQRVADDPTKDAKQREEAQAEASRLTRQIRDADFEDEKSKLDQRATLAGKNSAQVIAIREQEVARARAVYGAGSREEMRAEEELARAKEKGAERGAKAGEKAAKDALGATREGFDQQIQAAEKTAAEDVKLAEMRAKAHMLSAKDAAAAVKTALDTEKATVDALYARELQLAGLTATQIGEIKKKLALEDLTIAERMATNAEKAAEASTKAWTQGANEISGAINGQWRGLLSGQETWGQAAKKILGDWVITGIEDATKLAVNVIAQYVLMGNAATVSGAVQAAAQQTAAAGGIAALVANAVKAVTIDAGQTFAGVAAFLAPFLGPAALGPAAAASATVASVAAFDVGAWNVPHDQIAMIHKGEMVPTASQSEAIRSLPGLLAKGGGAGGPSAVVNPSTHFHVNAIDGASVSQFFRNNQRGMMRAVDEAVRHGAHLGLRRLAIG